MILVLHGESRSGKDTITQYLVEKYNYIRLSFADIPKQIIKETLEYIFDDTIEDVEMIKDQIYYKQKTFRDILQHFSTEICQTHLNKYIWTNIIIDKIKHNENINYIITDLRFQHEYETLLKLNNVYFIKLFRPLITNQQNNHCSNEPLHISFNYYIYNNTSIKDLYTSIDVLMKDVSTLPCLSDFSDSSNSSDSFDTLTFSEKLDILYNN
jgi:adenylate kinase family enzyme